ncbi:hypothetical protein RRG08_032858 [Elysia crispata]|uniref:G-protein coupled receptors family 1 profile domain-containing protein n=1 Tax=Elysia crispata TaxID=231223 RepID=A0AAE0ZLZ2_9GAST|nr:hypothetical protein RRG08_032858 [Elysia crispata]
MPLSTQNDTIIITTTTMTTYTISNISAPSNWSSSAHVKTLEEVNQEKADTLLPACIFLATLAVFGLVGNSLVCYVFGARLRPGTQNSLIVCLAVFDLLSCALGIPNEIADMQFYFTYSSEAACKIMSKPFRLPVGIRSRASLEMNALLQDHVTRRRHKVGDGAMPGRQSLQPDAECWHRSAGMPDTTQNWLVDVAINFWPERSRVPAKIGQKSLSSGQESSVYLWTTVSDRKNTDTSASL